jgi:hypothetical protein
MTAPTPPAAPVSPAAPGNPDAVPRAPTPPPPPPRVTSDEGDSVRGGAYELLHDKFTLVTSEPGKPYAATNYKRGDVVMLNDEQADRLVNLGAFGKPGQREQAEAERLMAAAQAAEAAATAAQEKVEAANAAAKAAAAKAPGK